MCREAKRNAVNRQLADELDAAFNLLEDDDGLWAGVLTGTGSVFCAGSDLTAGGDYLTERGGEYGLIRRRRRKPLIAAVEGPALGGGMELWPRSGRRRITGRASRPSWRSARPAGPDSNPSRQE